MAEENLSTPPEPRSKFNPTPKNALPKRLEYAKVDAAIDVLQKRIEDPTYQHDYPPDVFWEKPDLDPTLELQIWTNLKIMGETSSADDGWHAYLDLVDAVHQNPVVQEQLFPHIKFAHLHRLCRLLAGNKPKGHRQYRRLLSVMTYINYHGGSLQQFELNALIDNAGQGPRKIHSEDFAHARSVYNDLMQGHLPTVSPEFPREHSTLQGGVVFKPDKYTLSSLTSVAARGADASVMRSVLRAFDKHGVAPNRITSLSQLKHYIGKGDLQGLRMCLRLMRSNNFDIGIDGLNQCMDGYSRLGKVEVTIMIYRLLRHNLHPEARQYGDKDKLDDIAERLGEEYIFVEADVVPDEITYTIVIQAMAYCGDFQLAIEALLDRLSSSSAPGSVLPDIGLAEYRPILIGFKKYGVPTSRRNGNSGWTLTNLREIFKKLLELPHGTLLNHFTLYTIISAFDRCTEHDDAELRRIWTHLHAHFEVTEIKPHAKSTVAKLRRRLFPEDS